MSAIHHLLITRKQFINTPASLSIRAHKNPNNNILGKKETTKMLNAFRFHTAAEYVGILFLFSRQNNILVPVQGE